MSQVARTILPSAERCPKCGTPMLTTHDAIGRPRDRCPKCQGVVREPMHAGVVGPLHNQSATCKAELAWRMDPTPPPQARPPRTDWLLTTPRSRRTSAPKVRHCEDCGLELPAQVMGRPRRRCVDRLACSRRHWGMK